MPIPIKDLFDKEENLDIHCMPTHQDIIDMSSGCPNIPVSLADLPEVEPPHIGTIRHKEDLNSVKKHFLRPTNKSHFLTVSNEKPFSIMTNYVNDNNLSVDLEKLDALNDDLANLVLSLKFKYNRPRPKLHMHRFDAEFPYNKITPNRSPSYPSGHAAHAFFNACIISALYPSHEMKLRTLAEMIGQSRIDLGKHYPSDVSFGRFIGEYAAKKFLEKSHDKKIVKESKLKDEKKHKREKLLTAGIQHNKKNLGTSFIDELCEFLIRSNAIERYAVNVDEAYEAATTFMKGLPVKYCTKNKYIRSHLDALDEALLYDSVNDPKIVQNIHHALGDDVLERGQAGIFRPFEHHARSTGYTYTHPDNIPTAVLDWSNKYLNDPFARHVAYECIHPFSDGNGRSGRIILASDLNFNLAKLNDLIGDNYIPSLVEFQNNNFK